MNRIVLSFLVVLPLSACGLNWPAFATCAPSPATLLQQAAAALDAPDFMQALKDLAVQDGAEAVVCAVTELKGQLLESAKRTASVETMLRAGRADEFLHRAGTKVRTDPGPTAGGGQ